MSKSKTFRPWNREQTLLLLPSPMEWLPENHLVFFLLALAPELDLSAIYAVYEARDPVSSADPLVMPSRNLPSNAAGDPKANVQRNFTDPDSHNLKGGDGWIQGYNRQAAVDGDHQIIVSVGVSNQASDQHHFVPMLQRIVANTGQLPEKLIADAGYCSTGNIEASEQRGLDAYLSTSRQDHGKRPRPSRGPQHPGI